MKQNRKSELYDRINRMKMNNSTSINLFSIFNEVSKAVDDSREELNDGNGDKFDKEIFVFDHVQNNQIQKGQRYKNIHNHKYIIRPQQVGLIQQKKQINQQVNESMNQSMSISQMSQYKSPREDEQILDYGQQGNQLPNESIRSGDQSFAGDVLEDQSENAVNMNNYDSFPDDFKVSNRLSPLGLSLTPAAFVMTIKHMIFKPYLPFYIILLMIDILTKQSSIPLLSIYIVIMGFIAPLMWFIVIRSGLQMVYQIDSRLVQKYDLNESRFVEELRSNLKTGDIVALNTLERCPADMVPLFAVEKHEISGNYVTLDDGTSCKLLIPYYQINELQQLFIQIKYTELPAFGSVKELTLIHSQGSKSTQTQLSTFTIDDVIPTDQTISLGAIVGMVFMTKMTQLKSGVTATQSLQSKIAYEPKDSVNINNIVSVMIVVSVIMSIIGSFIIPYFDYKFLGHQYIQTDTNHMYELFVDNFISHLFIFQNIVPVIFEVMKPIFLLIARWKFNNDSIFGGFKYVESSSCRSPSLIDNLSSLKFINYNFNVFNQEVLKVGGLFMVSNVDEYSFLPAEPPRNFEELAVIDPMEFMLLGIPNGAQDYRLIGAQGYMLKMGGNSIFSRNNNKWVVLRSKKYLAQYQLEFTPVVAEEGTIIQLYSIPIKIYSKDTEIIKGKASPEVAGLTKEEEEEKKQQMLMKIKEYVWVVSCDRNSVFVNQSTSINWVNSELMIDDNSLFFFYFKMDQDGYNQFISVNGNVDFKSMNIQMNQDYWRILVRRCQPVGCFVYITAQQQDLSTLLDITKTSIRQWIFSEKMDQKTMDTDQTLMHMQKQTQWIELDQSQDIVLRILEVKDLIVKILNFYYFIRNRIIPRQERMWIHYNPNLLLDNEVFTKAILETKSLFKNLLIYPSFVIFQGLSAENKQIVISWQIEAMEDEYISITVGCDNSDLAYVSTGSAMGCLTNHEENLFTDLCQFNFVNIFSLKTLILSHARKTHIRISYFALFQIYKSLVIFSVEMFFSIFNGYSGLSLFPLSYHVAFQLLLTSFYGFSIFLFYQDLNNINERELGLHFWKCQQKVYFNANQIIQITIIAVFQGFTIFYVPSVILQSPTDSTGIIQGFYFISLVSFVSLISTVNIQPIILFQTLNMEQFASYLINIAWVIVVINFSSAPGYSTTSEQYIGHLTQLLAQLKSLFMIGLLTVINIAPVMLIQQYRNMDSSVNDENKEEVPQVFDQPKLNKNKYTVRSTNVNSTLNNLMEDQKKLQKKKLY